jgi:hypothetical protein
MAPLGSLIYYRQKPGRDLLPFEARAQPGLFAGWRIEPGCKYKCIMLVLDWDAVRDKKKGYNKPIEVHEKEVIIPEETVFPLSE